MRPFVRGLLLSTLLLPAATRAIGPSCNTVVGLWPVGPSYAVARSGSTVLFGRGRELTWVDVTTPASPQPLAVIGRLTLPGLVKAIALSSASPSLAAVALGDRGVALVDWTTPAQPALLAAIPTGGPALGLAFGPPPLDRTLFVAEDTVGLVAYDTTTPASPSQLGTADTPGNASDVTIGAFQLSLTDPWTYIAFVADGAQGVTRVDVTLPGTPAVLTSTPLDPPGSTTPAALRVLLQPDIADPRLYVAAGTSGLRQFRCSNSIFALGALDTQVVFDPHAGAGGTPGSTEGLARDGNLLYLADSNGGVRLIDETTYLLPSQIASSPTVGLAHAIALGTAAGDEYAFLAGEQYGLLVHRYQPSDLVTPLPWVNEAYAAGPTIDVAGTGRYAYLSDNRFGLVVIDLFAPGGPARRSPPSYSGTQGAAIAAVGNRVYLGDANGNLRVYDVANPAAPHELGSVYLDSTGSGVPSGIAVAGNFAFIAMGSGNRLVSVDVSNPASPQLLDSVALTGSPRGVALSGTLAYVPCVSGNALRIVDISNPAALQLLGSQPFNGALAMTMGGGIGLLGRAGQLTTLDLSTAAATTEITSLPLSGTVVSGVAYSAGFAHVSGGVATDGSIAAVDVSVAASPALAGTVDLPDFADQVRTAGDRILVADQNAGLAVLTDCRTLLTDGFETGIAPPGPWSAATGP